MREYVLRRILQLVPVLIGVSVVIFSLVRLIPGDVAYTILGQDPRPDQVAALRHELALDRPIYEQYFAWASRVVQGDLGNSLVYGKKPVIQSIAEAFPVTMELAILSTVLAILIGAPIAIISAVRQDTLLDYLFRVASIVGLSMPSFWLATLLFLGAALLFGWVPAVQGYSSPLDDIGLNIQQFILPAIAASVGFAAVVMRMTRSTLLEVLKQDYIRTAIAKGLAEPAVVTKHALRNALIPVTTLLGLHIGAVLGGAVIIENIFALPGMGRLLLTSVNARDYPTIQGVVLFLALLFVSVNLLVDIAYAWLDPRIRYS
jgi:peptide/nickel transport system permease protein